MDPAKKYLKRMADMSSATIHPFATISKKADDKCLLLHDMQLKHNRVHIKTFKILECEFKVGHLVVQVDQLIHATPVHGDHYQRPPKYRVGHLPNQKQVSNTPCLKAGACKSPD